MDWRAGCFVGFCDIDYACTYIHDWISEKGPYTHIKIFNFKGMYLSSCLIYNFEILLLAFPSILVI